MPAPKGTSVRRVAAPWCVPAKLAAPAVFTGWAIVLALLGQVPFGASQFPALIIVWNLFQSSGQALLNVLLTRVYPASMRSTAVGWAGGAGRVGGVVLPLFGGYVVAAQWSIGSAFLGIAIAPLVVALVVLCLRGPAPSSPLAPRYNP